MKKLFSGTAGLVMRIVVAALALTSVFMLFLPAIGLKIDLGFLGSGSGTIANGFEAMFGTADYAKFNAGMFIMFMLLLGAVVVAVLNIFAKKRMLDFIAMGLLAAVAVLAFISVGFFKATHEIPAEMKGFYLGVGPILIAVFAIIAAVIALLLSLFGKAGKGKKRR